MGVLKGLSDVRFLDFSQLSNDDFKYVVIWTQYKNNFVLVRHKDRITWEIPGGHREKGENVLDAAHRELREETGALIYDLKPIGAYWASDGKSSAYGGFYYAEVETFGSLPDMEIAEIQVFSELPEKLTYPVIIPFLFEKAQEWALSKT